MTNLLTLKTDLKRWLEGLPRDTAVGVRNDPNQCVLSNFLTGGNPKTVTVRKGTIKFKGKHGIKLPRWACTYYDFMDGHGGRITGSYTAADALSVLGTV